MPSQFWGVDFSGAKLAGRAIWLARLHPLADQRFQLTELHALDALRGTAERGPALAALVERIAASTDALWGLDFPFALPVELFTPETDWWGQLAWVATWSDPTALGYECVRRARTLGAAVHLRRHTERVVRTPFCSYHYRVIYQTYHGMLHVLRPLLAQPGTAIVPFQASANAARLVMETCPASTLQRLGWPHQRYKQPQKGPPTAARSAVRQQILVSLGQWVTMSTAQQCTLLTNPGGDALDAVLAALGTAQSWATPPPLDARARREGWVFA
jgi:hypothetical protein